MINVNEPVVAGEPASLIVHDLRQLKMRHLKNGMVSFSGPLSSHLQRALLRIEAELMVTDADGVVDGRVASRTYDQRRADAFVELAQRAVAAVAGP